MQHLNLARKSHNFFVKEPNHVDVYIASRIEILVSDVSDSKMVRDLAFNALIQDGLIPPQAKVGWLGAPDRRRGCTTKHHEYLDGLNRLFSAAKYYFDDEGKRSKTSETKSPREPISVKLTGVLMPTADGSFVVNFTGVPNVDQIQKFVRLNRGQRATITIVI